MKSEARSIALASAVKIEDIFNMQEVQRHYQQVKPNEVLSPIFKEVVLSYGDTAYLKVS